jgi:MoaD family protein
MPVLKIPAMMRSYAANQTEISLRGETLGEMLADFYQHFPDVKFHVVNKDGRLRHHIHIYINDENIKNLQGLDTLVKDGDKIILLPSIAGG